jgi:hypothetical protein
MADLTVTDGGRVMRFLARPEVDKTIAVVASLPFV